ncbi:MAG TPA: alpha-L-arabinofuranosidase C-terminal domain-containing protein [Vicinamibacterales bacterium]
MHRLRLPLLAVLVAFAAGATPAVDAQSIAQSSIVADFTAVKRVIPPFLFGQNLQTIDRGDFILRRDGSVDQPLLDMLSQLRITTLRFPGGTAADYFHWWQALGPQSGRPRQPSGNPFEFYDPLVGPEEFIRLSTALRAVPFVTANVGTGSPAEAAAFATHFERRGFPVTFWEVGNEVYFEGILGTGFVGPPPDIYAKKVIDYAAAIRKAAPYAKIYMAGVIGPEESDSYWNNVVLSLAGPYIDGISLHNAYFPLWGYKPDKTVPSDAYLFTAMLGATKVVERTMDTIEQQLNRLGRMIPIFVTEYDGIFFADKTVEDPIRTHQRNPTLGAALFNASVLQIFARHDRVYGAHHMAMAGPNYGSLIGIDGEVRFKNPQFYVHQEYSREAGNVLVGLTLNPQNAVFNSEPVHGLSGQTSVPMLDAMATRTPGSTDYALYVVNRSLTDTVRTSVSLNLPAGVTGTVSVLNGPSFAARNTAADPLRVSLHTTSFGGSGTFSYDFPPHSLTIFRWKR